MSKRLYIGNLSFATTEEKLTETFSQYGTPSAAEVMRDRDTNQSKGFGFIEFENDGEALSAIAALNGRELDGRYIRVEESSERNPRREGDSAAGFGERMSRRDRDSRFGSRRSFRERDDSYRGRREYSDRYEDYRPRREYGDRDEDYRPRRGYGDRDGDFRGRREYSDRYEDYRPRREYGDREEGYRARRDYGDRDGDFRGRREYSDREREYRPRREYSDREEGYRPRRDYGDRDGDFRARREYSDREREYRPRREYGDREENYRARKNPEAFESKHKTSYEDKPSYDPSRKRENSDWNGHFSNHAPYDERTDYNSENFTGFRHKAFDIPEDENQ